MAAVRAYLVAVVLALAAAVSPGRADASAQWTARAVVTTASALPALPVLPSGQAGEALARQGPLPVAVDGGWGASRAGPGRMTVAAEIPVRGERLLRLSMGGTEGAALGPAELPVNVTAPPWSLRLLALVPPVAQFAPLPTSGSPPAGGGEVAALGGGGALYIAQGGRTYASIDGEAWPFADAGPALAPRADGRVYAANAWVSRPAPGDYCILNVQVSLLSWGPDGPRVEGTPHTFTWAFLGRHEGYLPDPGGAAVAVSGNMAAAAAGCRSWSQASNTTVVVAAFVLLEITGTGLVVRRQDAPSALVGGAQAPPAVSVDVSAASGVSLVAWSNSLTGNTVIARWDGAYTALATVGGGFAQVTTGRPDPWEAYYSRGGTVYRRTAAGEAAVGSGSDPHAIWGPWGSMATWRDGGTAFRAHLLPAGGTAETLTVPYYADTADAVPDAAPAVRLVPDAPGYAVSAGRAHLIPWAAALEDNTILITLPDRTRLLRRSGTSWVAVEVAGGGAIRDITVSHTGTQICLQVGAASSCAPVSSAPGGLGVVRWGGLGLALAETSNGRRWGGAVDAGRWRAAAGGADAPAWPAPVMPMGASITWDPWRPVSEALPPAGLTGGEAGVALGTYALPAGQTQPAPVIAPLAGAVAPAGVSPSWLAALLALVLIPGAAVAAWRVTMSLMVTALAVVVLLWLLVAWGPLPLWLGVTGTMGVFLVYVIQARAY
jgi:hypothetical protein